MPREKRPKQQPPRCVAPLGDVPDDSLEGVQLCSAPATTERTVEDLVCPLCAVHAAEIDSEAE